MENNNLKTHKVWSKSTRIFHWINVLCIFGLLTVGLIIFNDGPFKFGPEARIMLKTVHVSIGYIFITNLTIRLLMGFIGDKHTRFGAFLPFGKNFFKDLKEYLSAFSSSKPVQYIGHNPMGRLAITALFILLVSQAVTGLVLAGTDLFFPPFGSYFADMVAASGVNPADVVPYNDSLVNPDKVKEMRAIRSPFGQVHVWGLYGISTMVVIHITSVIVTEIKHKGGLISAMFTGEKTIKGKAKDEE